MGTMKRAYKLRILTCFQNYNTLMPCIVIIFMYAELLLLLCGSAGAYVIGIPAYATSYVPIMLMC